MKNIINVEMKTRKVDFSKCETELLVVGVFSDAKVLDKLNKELDGRLAGDIEQLIKLGDFKGESETSAIVYGDGRITARRVLLVGLGEKKKATLDTIRKAAAFAANKAVTMKVENISLAIHRAFAARFDPEAMGQVMAEGAYLGSYRYDEYITKTEDGRLDSLSVELVDCESPKIRKLNRGLSSGTVIGRAQSYARTLANRPGNIINPPTLAAEAKKMAGKTAGLGCTVFDEKQLSAKGMGGVLAVGSGSKTGPRFIVLKYTPASKKADRLPTIALVGKAITFDSGGLSIKSAREMDQMKLDKSGGIAVLATMKATAELKLPLNVYGIIPSAENMPGGASYRPGDIITTFSGKTVEVQNTDAEGRMILCDALSYAVKQNCDIIIDIATLTGACMVALGKYMAGLMGNDAKLIKQLQKAAQKSGEKVWPMPSGDEYAKEMKSKIADLKNIGGRWGGACTGAAFLRQFAEEKKWAHLDMAGVDMAGVDMADGSKDTGSAGATGFGVRLLTTYLINAANKK